MRTGDCKLTNIRRHHEEPMSAQPSAGPSSLILLREDKDGVAILTLNRPQARNSLSEALLEALSDALSAIAHDRRVRVVIIAANGAAFSAGHDLKELNARRSDEDLGRAYFKRIISLCSRLSRYRSRSSRPCRQQRRRRVASSSPVAIWQWRRRWQNSRRRV